jgi:hypothetical protein
LLPVAAGLVALRWHEAPVGAVTDDAYYIEMARSTAEGLGPVLRVGPDVPARNPDIFPPGLPLLLAPLAKLFPAATGVLKLVPLFGGVVLVWLAWIFPPAGTDRRLRLAIMVVVALNPWLISWAGRVLSDLPFAALALGALALAARACERPQAALADFLLAGLTAGAAVAVRTVGWAAVLAIGLVLVLEHRRRHGAVFAVGLGAVLLPVWLLTRTGPLSGAYAAQMRAGEGLPWWRFALENLLKYVGELPVLLVPVFGAPVQTFMQKLHLGGLYPATSFALGVGILLLAGRAVVRFWRTPHGGLRVRLAVGYLVLTAAALANFHGYPSGVQTRLLLPVLPVLAWLVLAAVWPWRRVSRLVVGLMIVAALFHNGWRLARPLAGTVSPDGPGLVDPAVGADWVLANTTRDAVVMAQEPLQRHVHLRRATVQFPAAAGIDALAARSERYGVHLVLVAPSVHGHPRALDKQGRAMLELLQSQPARFQPAFIDTAEALYIYRTLD